MSSFNWKSLSELNGDKLLIWFHESEHEIRSQIWGVWDFVVTKIPDLYRDFLAWFQREFVYACKVAIRASRFAAVLVAWLAMMVGPLFVSVNVVTLLWMALVMAGSYWGIKQHTKKRDAARATDKEDSHART